MLVRLLAMLAVLTVAVGAGTTSASASTVTECQALVADLRSDTVAAQGAFTNARDFEGAVGKLAAAADKLAAGKTADASQKLVNFQGQLVALSTAPKPKLDPGTAAVLVGDAQGAIDCIAGLGSGASS